MDTGIQLGIASFLASSTGSAMAHSLLQCLGLIRGFLQDAIESRTELMEFTHQVDTLKGRLEVWEFCVPERERRQIAEELNRALEFFKSELGDLQKCSSIRIRIVSTLFPKMILRRVGAFRARIDSILELLQFEGDVLRAVAELRADAPFSGDEKYVAPPDDFIQNVRDKLESDGGKQAVYLYGEAGKGKSSFASYLAYKYQKGAGDYKRKENNGSVFPGGILRVDCRRRGLKESEGEMSEEEIKKKQQEMSEDESIMATQKLLKMLGPCISQKFVNETDPSVLQRYLRMLMTFWKEKTLIILDNVYSKEILLRLGEVQSDGTSTGKFKLLVTCRQPLDSSSNLNNTIPMHCFHDEGLAILSKHAGLEKIPEDCLELARKIVAETSSNPLALAYLGEVLSQKMKHTTNSKKQWEDLSLNLYRFLDRDAPAFRPTIFHEIYPRSVKETLAVVFENLKEEKHLLLTVAMFDGPSVQEDIVQLFFHMCYTRVLKRGYSFDVNKSILEKMGLLNRSEHADVMRDQEMVSKLSIYGLYQYFLLQQKRADIDAVLSEIAGGCTCTRSSACACDSSFSLAMWTFLGASSVAKLAENVAAKKFRMLAHSPAGIRALRDWLAIFLSLLDVESERDSDAWRKEAHLHAREVCHTFYKKGTLHLNEAMGELLKIGHEWPALATCCGVKYYLECVDEINSLLCRVESPESSLSIAKYVVACKDIFLRSLLEVIKEKIPARVTKPAEDTVKVIILHPSTLKTLMDKTIIHNLREALLVMRKEHGDSPDIRTCLSKLEAQLNVATRSAIRPMLFFVLLFILVVVAIFSFRH